LLIVIFSALGLIHIYWAVTRRTARSAIVPTTGGERAFEPSRGATLLVAAALGAAVVVIAGELGWIGTTLPRTVFRLMTFVISLLFLMRAIGDFRLVGFFKPASDSSFAYWDSRLFIALAAFIVMWNPV
jgi:hypothetical protein